MKKGEKQREKSTTSKKPNLEKNRRKPEKPNKTEKTEEKTKSKKTEKIENIETTTHLKNRRTFKVEKYRK